MQHHKYVNMQVATNFKLHGPIIDGETDTQLFATTPADAKKIMEERHMGERIDMLRTSLRLDPLNELPSELFAQGRLLEALHSACWLGMVACRAGVVKGEDLLDDNGVLHNLSHLCLPKEILDIQDKSYVQKMQKLVPKLLKELEEKTPGFHKYLTEKEITEARATIEKEREKIPSVQ